MERRSRSAGHLSGAPCGHRAAWRFPEARAAAPGASEPSFAARPHPDATSAITPSATRFRPPPRPRKVAHACQTGPLRENTDPPTTGNP
ncbi:hypothetical protein CFB84_00550 [Burkholderia aenigmatica]|uniref:Uncharacterized protein n=1 Tax=Burkholderia aenigmatica TaxID=2015348 RepID=A0A228J4K2_9BURK|nr:hypothetical protein CFB84_00550 [Burkholderia aenigmatica]